MMPLQIGCECGKRYRVRDDAHGKRFRCKECGKELVVPRKRPATADDEFDLAHLDLDNAAANDEVDNDDGGSALPPRARRSAKKRRGRKSADSSRFTTGDIVVRAFGMFVVLATLANCAYQFHAAVPPPDNKGPAMDTLVWAIIPIPIFGLIGLYVACVGEEPDQEKRRANRHYGLVKCGFGLFAVALGVALTIAANALLLQFAAIGVVFTGLMIVGAGFFVYGGLSALTGREFRMNRWE